MDLSDTELASTFNRSYLRSYTCDDGTLNWLPTCAEVDSIIVNKTLLEENGLSVPTNYGELTAVCDTLRENGIRPFVSNFAADFTCMEVLQGLSASVLTSQEGREWRQQYESGQADTLSEKAWLPVFERMTEFLDHTDITSADLELAHKELFTAFVNGEMVMIRGTGDEVERYNAEGRELVLCRTTAITRVTIRYLTYPVFQIAASVRAEESGERERLILDIMTAMLSEDGLRKIAANQNMVSYNSEVKIDLSPSLEGIKAHIDSNRLYIRLASSDMFSVSQQVVQGIIKGDYPDARSVFDAFNAALETEEAPTSNTVHIDKSCSYDFEPKGGFVDNEHRPRGDGH